MRGALLLIALIGAGACGGADVNVDVATVKTRASFDLNCPEDEVRGRWLDDNTLGVTACGKRATYVKECHSNVTTSPLAAAMSEDCRWIMNNSARPTGE